MFTPDSDATIFLQGELKNRGILEVSLFEVWGSIPGMSGSGLTAPLGTGISVLVGFEQKLLHVMGRFGGIQSKGGLLSKKASVREIAYSGIEAISLTDFDGSFGLLTLSVKGKGGLVQQALGGSDVVLALSKSQIEGQRTQIDELRARLPA